MKEQTKLPKATIIICSIAVLFAVASSYAVNSVRATAQSMYEHPYTVTNAARAMRSRLLDMKRFVSMFLTTSFENEEKARELFEERYDMQNEAIESIRKHYLGSAEDVTNLRKAMDDLIAIQEEALLFVRNHTKEEILDFIDERVYPYYDALNDCLERIIVSSDTRIYELTKNVEHTSVVSIATALLLASFIIFLTIYSNIAERKSVKALEARGYELQDALLPAQKANNAKKDSSRHLLSLINNVLDMSKIDAGKLTVNHELFHMQELAESVVLLVDSQAKAQEKNFVYDITGIEHESLIGDCLRVNQILLNLLSNAVKFTPQGGMIQLEIQQRKCQNGKVSVRFIVSDTGIGMSEDFLNRLFVPFEQAGTHISQKYGGTGLGMAITYNLVNLLGGSIDVKSKLGEGTTFTVELPFDLPEDIVDYRTCQLDSLKVLVVDDEEDACIHAGMLLKRMGITAQYTRSGEEAVRIALEAHDAGAGYDVCIVDWRMPCMDGVEVTRKIRETLGSDALIIIISAYDWSEIEEEARQAGADAFIAKPLFESALNNVLVSVFGTNPSSDKPEVPEIDYTGSILKPNPELVQQPHDIR